MPFLPRSKPSVRSQSPSPSFALENELCRQSSCSCNRPESKLNYHCDCSAAQTCYLCSLPELRCSEFSPHNPLGGPLSSLWGLRALTSILPAPSSSGSSAAVVATPHTCNVPGVPPASDPDPGIRPGSYSLQMGSLPTEPPGKSLLFTKLF